MTFDRVDVMGSQSLEEQVRGHELMCYTCGCTHWCCLTKFEGECCDSCDHPSLAVGS